MKEVNLYVDAENIKAISHFQEKGCEFFGSMRYYYACCSACGEPYAERKILYVASDFVKDMSGTQFHNYLKENRLLMTQQVEV